MENNDSLVIELLNKGIAEYNASNFEAAVLFFSKVLEIKSDTLVLNNRAISYRQLGQFDLALADINTAISISPNDALYYSTRAAILTKLHKQLEAIDDLDKAIEIEPQVEYVINKIVILRRLNRYQDALATINDLENQGLKSVQLSVYKGIVLFDIKKFNDAEFTLLPLVGDPEVGKLATQYLKQIKSNLN